MKTSKESENNSHLAFEAEIILDRIIRKLLEKKRDLNITLLRFCSRFFLTNQKRPKENEGSAKLTSLFLDPQLIGK